ncbi:MAG: M23 family metallopeptidase, partial [Caldiserica bacterium]|nr:M23 family metallopeptidase [Caldisericota bacterium]
VEVGEWIGANGSTGNSSAPHVHFEVHLNGHTIDPETINWTIRKMPPRAY